MRRFVTLKLGRKDDAGDHRVFWYENGKIDYGPTYYTPDIQDAVSTMMLMAEKGKEDGMSIQISNDKYTQEMIQRHYL